MAPPPKRKSGAKPAGRKPVGAKPSASSSKAKSASKPGKAGKAAFPYSRKPKAGAKKNRINKPMGRGKGGLSVTAVAAAAKAKAPKPNEPGKQLAHRIAALVLEKKGSDVLVLDVRGKATYADYIVIGSAESDRQVAAMADGVELALKGEGQKVVSIEGTEGGNWVLLDYGDVVAHLFNGETRGFYDLEGLWADAPREPVKA
jgi:ribosome-associated protein